MILAFLYVCFFSGFMLCFVFFFVSYVVLKKIIFKYGKEIKRKIEKEIYNLEQPCIDGAEILFPDETVEVFKKQDSKLDDLLK